MNNIAILAFVALTITSLAFIHETRLRRAMHNLLRRMVKSLGQRAERKTARETGVDACE
jgi:hypothetical protein